jgi:hypothetical protein
MARSPQSFEKRQRERRKQQKREEKLERRLIRSEEKRREKAGEAPLSEGSGWWYGEEDKEGATGS